MDDTTYTFISDIREKKSTASGARHRVCGAKSKKCTLPHEKLTPAQLRRRNGPVKTYSCSRPCTYFQFTEMPEDIQKQYLTNLLSTHGASVTSIAMMWEVTSQTVRKHFSRLGIPRDRIRCNSILWSQFLRGNEEPQQEAVCEPEAEPQSSPAPIIRTNASIHLSYTGTPYQVLSFLLNCSMGQDDSQVFDIDITFADHKEV